MARLVTLNRNGHGAAEVTPRGNQRRSFPPSGFPHIMQWADRAGPKCLRPAHRLVLRCLAAHSTEQGISWPSQETIAEYCGFKSTVAVRNTLQELQAIRMIAISIREVEDGQDPHQYEYRLDGAYCEWLPFDYGDPVGDITLTVLVARQRDQLQVENYGLQVESDYLRERLSNYEEVPPKGSSIFYTLTENIDEENTTTTLNLQKPPVRGRAEEIERYLKEHWECLRDLPGRPEGLRSIPKMVEHYAQDLAKFDRDSEDHLDWHESSGFPAGEVGVEDANADVLWGRMAALLIAQPAVTDMVWEAWLSRLEPRMGIDGSLILLVPTPYNMTWLDRKVDLSSCYRQAGGTQYVRLVLSPGAEEDQS